MGRGRRSRYETHDWHARSAALRIVRRGLSLRVCGFGGSRGTSSSCIAYRFITDLADGTVSGDIHIAVFSAIWHYALQNR